MGRQLLPDGIIIITYPSTASGYFMRRGKRAKMGGIAIRPRVFGARSFASAHNLVLALPKWKWSLA
jgi:hypothetical protein